MVKSLKEISWNVDEDTYRKDPSLSYSIIAGYLRGGFHSLSHLFEKEETPALKFGSIVDTLMTEPEEVFKNKFYIVDGNNITGKIKDIIDYLIEELGGDSFGDIEEIDPILLLQAINKFDYNPKWGDKAKINAVISNGKQYYRERILSRGKILITKEDYQDALLCVNALRESEATKRFFFDDPFNNDIEILYQTKFKGSNNNIPYRCMFDLLIVDHKNKIIYPKDLKTTGDYEDEFYRSFIKWNYDIQARNYYRLLKQAIEQDDYFKDFEIDDFEFIVINRNSRTPLIWRYDATKAIGDIELNNPQSGKSILMKDPWIVGEKLWSYLTHPTSLPDNIKENEANSIIDFIQNEYLS